MTMKKVLVVDDSATIRTAISWVLRDPNIEVVARTTGSEASPAIESELPDLVLIDLGLPDVNGFDLAEQIRARYGPKPPLVLMSPSLEPFDEDRSIGLGIEGRIPKPFTAHQLLDVASPFLGLEVEQAPPLTYAGRLAARRAAEQASKEADQQLEPSTPAFEAPSFEAPSFEQPPPDLSTKFQADLPAEVQDDLPAEVQAELPAEGQRLPTGPELEPPPMALQEEAVEVDVWSLTDEPSDEPGEATASQVAPVAPLVPAKPLSPPQRATSDVSPEFAGVEASVVATVASASSAVAAQAQMPGLDREELRQIAREAMEKVAWEVVPDLAETIIREELARLTRP